MGIISTPMCHEGAFSKSNPPLHSSHDITSLLQQMLQSQQACIADISTFNKSLTPPNYTHNNTHRLPDQLCASHRPFNHHQP
ncbi:hypothetical protein A2U01_0063255, partial [Trifolium medium]|nr:hypothetical protein [Trifolium medium]